MAFLKPLWNLHSSMNSRDIYGLNLIALNSVEFTAGRFHEKKNQKLYHKCLRTASFIAPIESSLRLNVRWTLIASITTQNVNEPMNFANRIWLLGRPYPWTEMVGIPTKACIQIKLSPNIEWWWWAMKKSFRKKNIKTTCFTSISNLPILKSREFSVQVTKLILPFLVAPQRICVSGMKQSFSIYSVTFAVRIFVDVIM